MKKNQIIRDIILIIVLVIVMFLMMCVENNSSNENNRRIEELENEVNELWDCVHALDEQYVQLHGEIYNTYN